MRNAGQSLHCTRIRVYTCIYPYIYIYTYYDTHINISYIIYQTQVTSFIAEQTAVNGIVDASALSGFTVGTLAKTKDLLLANTFSFDNVYCADLKVLLSGGV
jgi:hypothetical protein